MSGLQGKRIVIAGGAGGIGAATAERLAKGGARVIVGDLKYEGAVDTAERIVAAGGEAYPFGFDLAEPASTEALIHCAIERFGGLDGLANIAADLSPETIGGDADLLEMDIAVWERALKVNLIGYALTCRAAIRAFLAHGKGGSIVNVSSEVANTSEDTRPAYSASKAGVNALTRHISMRWGKNGIRCNSVSPGIVMTETSEAMVSEEFKAYWVGKTTLGRFARAPELANVVAFLLSDEASYVDGQVWHVNGGAVLHG